MIKLIKRDTSRTGQILKRPSNKLFLGIYYIAIGILASGIIALICSLIINGVSGLGALKIAGVVLCAGGIVGLAILIIRTDYREIKLDYIERHSVEGGDIIAATADMKPGSMVEFNIWGKTVKLELFSRRRLKNGVYHDNHTDAFNNEEIALVRWLLECEPQNTQTVINAVNAYLEKFAKQSGNNKKHANVKPATENLEINKVILILPLSGKPVLVLCGNLAGDVKNNVGVAFTGLKLKGVNQPSYFEK